jgi:antirestriction protein
MTIKVFLTNLGMYNEGYFVLDIGRWVELPIDDEEIKDILKQINVVPNSKYEEFFITDFESPFPVGEYENIFELNKLAESIEDLDDEVVKAIYSFTQDQNETVEIIQNESYVWHSGMTLKDYAEQRIEEEIEGLKSFISDYGDNHYVTNLIDRLSFYINAEIYARDLDIEGTFFETIDGLLEIF